MGGRESNDRQKEETDSTTGHEHVLLSILAINARYSVYLMTVLVQFLREREEKKKRDGKSRCEILVKWILANNGRR